MDAIKKGVVVITAIFVVILGGLTNAHSCEKCKMGHKEGKMGGAMMEKGMMGMCPMMKSMTERTIIATSDGGIVIVMGNKLSKYDKNLNLIKEVELRMDMEGMQKMMDHMKSMCPMMGKMKMSTEDSRDEESKESVEEETEHSHH